MKGSRSSTSTQPALLDAGRSRLRATSMNARTRKTRKIATAARIRIRMTTCSHDPGSEGGATSPGEDENRSNARSLRRHCDEPELDGVLDRVASAGDAELPVDGDRLRLDRVARDVQAGADLAEGEVRREQRQQPELRARQTGAVALARRQHRVDLALQLQCLRGEDAEIGPPAQ